MAPSRGVAGLQAGALGSHSPPGVEIPPISVSRLVVLGVSVTPHYLSLDAVLDVTVMAESNSVPHCQRCP